ncbi:MAG: NirA family protein [Burkholderiales bacterium]
MSNPEEFTEEQKQYLQGLVSGLDVARGRQVFVSTPNTGIGGPPTQAELTGPDAIHLRAQNRVLAEGKALTPEERAKRKKHPLDMWDELVQHGTEGRYPKGTDVLAFKYHGLFYAAPAQDSYMCRLRLHGGILRAEQLHQVADIAQRFGGGYAHVTTRANLQIREIRAADAVAMLTQLHDAGIIPKGSGADNIRNITGSPAAGIDPHELIDTRALSSELHHYILNHREMYGLPRKFNIAFDGGGSIAVLEDTNDIGFFAVRVGQGRAVPAAVYFRMALGGITGHNDFARDTGVLLKPEQCVPVAAAVVRVFIEHGDRTDRQKARLKYVLDRWGLDKYLEETQKLLPFALTRLPLEECEPRSPLRKHAHIGIHPQRQDGLYYIGVALPLGKLTTAQMHGLTEVSQRYGTGVLRLTVWQNLLVSDIREEHLPAVQQAIESMGLHWDSSEIRAGLIACTGNTGCLFAASDTKYHATQIADHLEARIKLDQPITIHLTGCPHSCAQHHISDIGLLGTKTQTENDEEIESYHVYVGGSYGSQQKVAREVYRGIAATDVPRLLERMLSAYLAHRTSAGETFNEFVAHHSSAVLHRLFEGEPVLTA